MTPVERLELYRDRIERLGPDLGAFLDLCWDEARREAEASAGRVERGEALSPIDGLCFAIKVNIAVRGLPCHAGIDAYRDDVAKRDAEVVARIREKGGIVLGTVNMHEGALGATTDNPTFGRTQNPWRHGWTPGGSSGGSAAAVAAGLCDIALGSDTMGSVRIPSAYCGVQGHKPTPGRISLEGVLALSPTLDHVGAHARRVEDLASFWQAVVGERVDASPEARFGIWSGADRIELEPEVREGFDQTLEAIRDGGAQTVEIDPEGYAYGKSRRAGLLVSEREAAAIHEDRLAERPEGFSDAFKAMMAWGREQDRAAADGAHQHIRDLRERASASFEKAPLILAPTAPQTAFSFDAKVPANQADFTAWANLAGLPAVSIFSGLSSEGLPLGVQVIGQAGTDARVLSAAAWLEQVLGAPPVPPDCSGELPT